MLCGKTNGFAVRNAACTVTYKCREASAISSCSQVQAPSRGPIPLKNQNQHPLKTISNLYNTLVHKEPLPNPRLNLTRAQRPTCTSSHGDVQQTAQKKIRPACGDKCIEVAVVLYPCSPSKTLWRLHSFRVEDESMRSIKNPFTPYNRATLSL